MKKGNRAVQKGEEILLASHIPGAGVWGAQGAGPPTCCEREQVELSASMKHLHYFLLMIDLLCYGWQSLLMWFDL